MSRYIVFEGCDYTGKTTYAKALVESLNFIKPGCAVYTKEPGSPLSKACVKIRELILSCTDIQSPETYSYLFAADTFEHTTSYVIPELVKNKIIVSDRSVISDFAYRPDIQVNLRHYNLNKFKSLEPIVIWCVSDEDTIQTRYLKRSDTNEFERKHVFGKLKAIHEAYERFFNNNQDINVIQWQSVNDDNKDQQALFDRILKQNA